MTKTHFKNSFILSLFFLFPLFVIGQQQHLIFNQNEALNYEKYLYSHDAQFHTSLKPYVTSDVYPIVFPDTLYKFDRIGANDRFFRRAFNIIAYENWLDFDESGYIRKSRKEEVSPGVFVRHNYTDTTYIKRKFHIVASPYVRFELGYDNATGSTISYNKRGVALYANIGDKVSIFTSFSENQAKFPEYLTGTIQTTRVIPGEGKARNFGTNSFDFSNVWAYLTYAPNKYFSAEVGTGKHFIGDGYRSLLLSDNAFVYPYFKGTFSIWKIKYRLIYAELQNDIRERTDFATGVTRKFANFNYLSFEANGWFQVGLFEGILWPRTGPNGNNEFNWNYVNPIIGIRGLQKNLDVNTVYGLNYKVTLPKYAVLYGQWMIDKFPTDGKNHINNRMGFQAGVKYYDVGGVENLFMQFEYNRARPFSYSSSDSTLHYSQYDQPLAHPLGSNFNEYFGKIAYRYKRFYTNLSVAYSKGGLDQILVDTLNGSFLLDYRLTTGSEIFLDNSLAPNRNGINVANSGSNYKLLHADLRLGYILNPKINLKIELGIIGRRSNTTEWAYTDMLGTLGLQSVKETSAIVVFSLSTQLFNNYYDNIPRISALPVIP